MKRLTAYAPALCAAVLLIGIASESKAVLYRWVDEEGTVHYTDTLPPDYVEQARTEFSQSGLPVNRVPRAKTPEEIRQEQELARLRSQQQILVDRLRAADRVLLRTFRSEDDLLRARDGKIATIDVMIQVTKNNIRRQETWLAELRTEAANLERAGKPIPEHLQAVIRKTEASIREGHDSVARREEQKTAIRNSFEQDLQRFKQLLNGKAGTGKPASRRALRPVLHEIAICSNQRECDLFWGKAQVYLTSASAFEIQIGESNDIIIVSPWKRRNEVRLILTRIADSTGPGASLFLELQCQFSLRGTDLCKSPELIELAEGFSTTVAPQNGAGGS